MKLPKCRGQKIKVTVEDVDNIAFCISEGLTTGADDEEDSKDGKSPPKNNMAVSENFAYFQYFFIVHINC